MLRTELYPQIHVGVLNPSGTAFGDRTYKEVIKVKRIHKIEALIPQDYCPYKKWYNNHRVLSLSASFSLCPWIRGQLESCHIQARKRPLTRNQTGWHLHHALRSLQDCEKINFCCLCHQSTGFYHGRPNRHTPGIIIPTFLLNHFWSFTL